MKQHVDKFKNKYRIASARAPFWDYSSNAAYFITICTKNRICWFGDVIHGKMELSTMGHIANSCRYGIPGHFPFVKLGAHIIMPNHVHGSVVINKPDDGPNVETQNFASLPSNVSNPPNPMEISEPLEINKPKNQFGPQSKNLASIIRGFKIGVTKNAQQINSDFTWQSRYYDHIIRNEKSYQTVSEYIVNNPLKWQEDKFFVSNGTHKKIKTKDFPSQQHAQTNRT